MADYALASARAPHPPRGGLHARRSYFRQQRAVADRIWHLRVNPAPDEQGAHRTRASPPLTRRPSTRNPQHLPCGAAIVVPHGQERELWPPLTRMRTATAPARLEGTGGTARLDSAQMGTQPDSAPSRGTAPPHEQPPQGRAAAPSRGVRRRSGSGGSSSLVYDCMLVMWS